MASILASITGGQLFPAWEFFGDKTARARRRKDSCGQPEVVIDRLYPDPTPFDTGLDRLNAQIPNPYCGCYDM